MRKVFVVGLSKTGTTSLHAGLELMGLRALHNPESMLRLENGALRFSPALAADYDALSDLPIAVFFRELDRAFPGSRFILTTRDEESWLASCANHFDASVFRPNAVVRKLMEAAYGTAEFDATRFREALRRHDADVGDYFAKRPGDLLIVDIAEADKWKPLSEFLGVPIPAAAYPHENRASRIPPPVKRVLRWMRRGLKLG